MVDIWDKEFRDIYIRKDHLAEQAARYYLPVRFAMGWVKTGEEFERDKKRILAKR